MVRDDSSVASRCERARDSPRDDCGGGERRRWRQREPLPEERTRGRTEKTKELNSLCRSVRESVGCGADFDYGRKKRVSQAVVPTKSPVATRLLGVTVAPLQFGERARGREKEGSSGDVG